MYVSACICEVVLQKNCHKYPVIVYLLTDYKKLWWVFKILERGTYIHT